ncbi:hypothetical protein E1B28_013353 [Marasmius oreades]|uniref:OTU domain-containing protein n=1 Tax=Marasmius oreades TaxID=181124 RepID=A0A9P7UMX3_9AGAR|nr:uncharacterized protein E1B28_013353 [Marasmius oreades]KAG7087380.1 hypothetical protein E1B28_013353 [Marasmius oreades]
MGSAKKQHAKTFRTRATRSTGKANLLTSDPSRNTELLNNQLRSLGLYAAPTLGDGNCLFRALSDQYYGSPSKHHQVRRDICDFIEDHPERYEGFVDVDEFGDAGARKGKGGGLKAYVAGMRQNAVYGGHMELSAFAQLTQRNIKVIQPGLVYVIQYDPPEPSTSNVAKSPTTPKKRDKKSAVDSPSKSAMAVDDTPSRHTRSSAKLEATLNDREKRHRRRELQRKREEEAKRKQVLNTEGEETEEDVQDDDTTVVVNEPQTSGPNIYVAYHDWEHFSSVRNSRGPHSGIPNVEEIPAPSSYASSSSSHTSNSPFSQAGSQTSQSSIPDEQPNEDLSPAKVRKREREKKEREKKEKKVAKGKEKASGKPQPLSSSKGTMSMDRFLRYDPKEAKASKVSVWEVKSEPVDDVLPPPDSTVSLTSGKTGFKLKIPPRKAIASSPPTVLSPSHETIDVDSYPTPSPLTSDTESEEGDVNIDGNEDATMASPTKPTSSTTMGLPTGSAPSAATSPPASHSPSPAPALGVAGSDSLNNGIHSHSKGTSPGSSGNPYLNINMALSYPNLPNPHNNLNMSHSNGSLPNLSNPPQQQVQAQTYMAAMYSYAAAAGYPPYAMYGYPSPNGGASTGSIGSSSGGTGPSHLLQQYPYGFPTGYSYGYGYAYSPSPSPSSGAQAPNLGHRAGDVQVSGPPTPNPYMHMQGPSYPVPYMQTHYSQVQQPPQPQPSPESQTQPQNFIQAPANSLSHLTHLCSPERGERSPKRSFEESFSDDISDMEKDKSSNKSGEGVHSRSMSKDSTQDPTPGVSCSPSRSGFGSGSESEFKRSRIDRWGKRNGSRRSVDNGRKTDNVQVVDGSNNSDLAASDITIRPPMWSDADADVDADADGDPDPDFVEDEPSGLDRGNEDTEEEREVEHKLSSGFISTFTEAYEDHEDPDDDDLEPDINRSQSPSSAPNANGKIKNKAPERTLTRRQRKKLGLPKSHSGAGKIVIPGGKHAQTGPADEWLANGAGRVDVRGFRELKI